MDNEIGSLGGKLELKLELKLEVELEIKLDRKLEISQKLVKNWSQERYSPQNKTSPMVVGGSQGGQGHDRDPGHPGSIRDP